MQKISTGKIYRPVAIPLFDRFGAPCTGQRVQEQMGWKGYARARVTLFAPRILLSLLNKNSLPAHAISWHKPCDALHAR
jgi:hypothetical protein